MFIRNSCLKKCLFVFSGVKAWCKNFENRVWKNSCIKKCLFVFPGVTRWMSIFLRKGCEKNLIKTVFATLGSKFEVRIFEKGVWEKILSKKCLFVFLGVKLWSEKNICHVKEIPKGCENLNICSSGGLKSDVRMFEKKGVKN